MLFAEILSLELPEAIFTMGTFENEVSAVTAEESKAERWSRTQTPGVALGVLGSTMPAAR